MTTEIILKYIILYTVQQSVTHEHRMLQMTNSRSNLQTNPRRRAVPNGHVLTSEEFMEQIKIKEEKAETVIKQREERKRKKDEEVLLKTSGKKTKKPKVLVSMKYYVKENVTSVTICF